jgi:hypothetical protein
MAAKIPPPGRLLDQKRADAWDSGRKNGTRILIFARFRGHANNQDLRFKGSSFLF